MVVTRRTPVVPAPPTSRTSSSQALSRAAKSKVSQVATDADDIVAPPGNGAKLVSKKSAKSNPNDVTSRNKRKHKSKSHTDKGVIRRLIDLLERVLLFGFIIYTLSVCPNDAHLQSPVCRGLSIYREYVLEPYILPPLQAAISHPAVAPYVNLAKPHIERVVNTAVPILLRAQHEWNLRVVPEWNKRIVPQWNKRIIPLWMKHGAPRLRLLDNMVDPYRLRLRLEYNNRIAPHVNAAFTTLRLLQLRTQPYILLAASQTRSGYERARPYVLPLLHRLGHLLEQWFDLARAKRRKFVDPHVNQIWDKFLELSSGKPESVKDRSSNSFSAPLATSIASSQPSEITAALSMDLSPSPVSMRQEETYTATSAVSAVTPESSTGVDHPISDISPDAESTSSSDEATLYDATPSDPLVSASSIISASVYAEPSILSSFDDKASSVLSPSSTSLATTGPSIVSLPDSSSSAELVMDEDEIDLESFYAELGLVSEEEDSPGTSSLPPVYTESEEEKTERRRLRMLETAAKRKDLDKRHKEWEEKLTVLIKEKKKELRQKLVAIRKPAAAELKENAEIRNQIERLVTETEKLLKAVEVYLKTLKKEDQKIEDKITLWDRVMEKLEAKFDDKLKETEQVVNGWYKVVYDQEMNEVQNLAQEVKEFAQRAQADIGMDYAWLDDVTYDDWQRYHDLINRSEDFLNQARSIQNGSHPSPPVNPVLRGVDDLESEVEDIVMGFQTRLRGIKRNGWRAFNVAQPDDEADEESFGEPEASVLPMPSGDPQLGQGDAIPPVFIGRSEDEVKEALHRALPGLASTASPPEATGEATSIAQDLASEAAEQQSPIVSHVEL